MFFPLYAEISCENGKISASVMLLKLPIYLYPKRNKSRKKKKEKKLELNAGLIGKLLQSISLKMLRLRFISAGDDPYDAVMRYNCANAIAGFFYPFIDADKRDIEIKTDFEAKQSELSAFLKLKISIYKLLPAIPILIKQRKTKHGKQIEQHNADNDE